MNKSMEMIVQGEDTLLAFLLSHLSHKSRNYVKGVLKRGQISVDGTPCTDYARRLIPGQHVSVMQAAQPVQSDLGFAILYEDDDLLVIDKPAGMLAVATDNERENTAYRLVTDYVRLKNKSGRVFIVHRLDRETSGVMLFAKSERVKLALQDNWDDAVITRGYIAVVEGKVAAPAGTMKSWLRQTRTLLSYSSKNPGDGKLAITHYKTVKGTDKYSLLEVSLETGRKNQIRVHMKDMGHPVAGDKKYGAATDPLKRLGLHAAVLTLKHPTSGAEMSFEAKTPRVFGRAFA